LTGYLAHQFGYEFATGAIHDFQGIFTFGLAFLMLLGEGRLIDLIIARTGSGASPSGKSESVEPTTS
jgi:hypothetical protein